MTETKKTQKNPCRNLNTITIQSSPFKTQRIKWERNKAAFETMAGTWDLNLEFDK